MEGKKIYILEGNTLKNHDICSKIGTTMRNLPN